MGVGVVDELLLILNEPVTAPAVLGLKVICMVRDCPAASVIGVPLAVIAKPVPLTVAELIVREPVPDEVSVSDKAFDVPSVTLP